MSHINFKTRPEMLKDAGIGGSKIEEEAMEVVMTQEPSKSHWCLHVEVIYCVIDENERFDREKAAYTIENGNKSRHSWMMSFAKISSKIIQISQT